MENVTLYWLSNVIHFLALVFLVVFMLWLRPRLDAVGKLVNMYKGFGTDYEKWKKQHDDEYRRLEQQMSGVKEDFAKYRESVKTRELVNKLQVRIDNVTGSVDTMETFVTVLETLEKALEIQTTKSQSWLERAYKANQALEFLKKVKLGYTELIKEGKDFIKEVLEAGKEK